MTDKRLQILRQVLTGLFICIALFLLWTIIVPSGRVRYTQTFQDGNFQRIDKIKPIERTLPPTESGQAILGGPVYFKVNEPRRFNEAQVKITYRTNPNFNHPQLELGLLTSKALWQYQLKPIENRVIEKTEQAWTAIRSDGELLLQRQAEYASIDDFKSKPPLFERIATYNDDWQLEKNFSEPKPGQSQIDWQLQGGYQLFALVGGPKLEARFSFHQNPEKLDEAPMTEIQLYQGRNLVAISKLSAQRAVGDQTEQWSYDFKAQNLKPGYYKVVLRADSNLITDKITVNQANISFVGRLKFSKQAVPTAFWTNSRELNFLAASSESVGDVYLNQSRQLIFETYKQYSYKTNARDTQIRLTKPGLEIAGDGVFAPAETQLFDPRLKQIDSLTDLDKEKIDFILARYSDVSVNDGWKQATVDFNLARADLDNGSYAFLLSVPGFKSDDEQADWLEIKSIEVELRGDNLYQIIRNFLKKAVYKLLF
jgi:hypothetical protein